MTTFTVIVEDPQSEKVLTAFLDALGIVYHAQNVIGESQFKTKEERELFDRLKKSLTHVKQWENGEIELNDARSFLNEISG